MVVPRAFQKAAPKAVLMVDLLAALLVVQKAHHLVPLRAALRICAFLPRKLDCSRWETWKAHWLAVNWAAQWGARLADYLAASKAALMAVLMAALLAVLMAVLMAVLLEQHLVARRACSCLRHLWDEL